MADLSYISPYYGMISANPSFSDQLSSWANKSTLLGGSASAAAPTSSWASMSMPQAISMAGTVMGVFGGIQSGFGAYFSAKSTKSNLEFQADMAKINARMSENQAQSILDQGNKAIASQTLKAGKVMSSQKASQGARGIAMGEGSAAEEIATTDLMKEIDKYTINANAVRAAEAARMQSVNYSNESLLKGATAEGISPFSAASTSLINSATSVASSWYSNRQQSLIAQRLGIGV